MKQLEEFDPSAIDAIEFNVSSVKKYTSVFTIVLSLVVIILSFAINAQTLTEVYKPRKELQVSSLKMKAINYNLTDQALCIVYLPTETVSSTVFFIYETDDGTFMNKTLPRISALDGFGSMASAIGDKAYNCFNLKGIAIKKNDNIKISTDYTSNTKILISCHSITSVLNEDQQQIMQIPNTMFLVSDTTYIYLSTNLFILMERLMINYDPQYIYTLQNKIIKYSFLFMPAPKTQIFLMFNEGYFSKSENYLGVQYMIIRKNIAEIIGNVLAWRGLILIPVSIMLILFPIVQKYYKFQLVKARFDSQVINTTNFGFITDIKRRLSNFFSCFPRQKLINQALQKIDQELDIVSILQLQSIMRRQRSQFNQIQREQDIFDCKIQQKDVKMDQLLQNGKQETQNSRVSLGASHKQVIFAKNQQKDRNPILETIKSFIYGFDDTQTSINISTNQGKGYGSVWSLCSFILLSASICFILVFLGTFSLGESDTMYNAYSIDKQQLVMNIPSYSMAFRNHHDMTTGILYANLVDENDVVLQTINLVNDDNCNQLALQSGYQTTDWFCIPEDTQISNMEGSKTRIKITTAYSPVLPDFLILGIATIQTIFLTQTGQGQKVAETKFQAYSILNSIFELKQIIKNNNGDKQFGYQLKSIVSKTSSQFALYITLSNDYMLIEHDDGSYWNLFDSAWGIVILASELILFKVGKMINSKILSSKLNTEKQQKRSDILTVLFDVDRLSKGIYKQELSSVGFYYKHKLPNQLYLDA